MPADLPREPRLGEVLVRIEGLEKHFPIKGGLLGRVRGHVRAVDGVSLDILKGETLGVVGESGCGKTTVGRLLVNLIPPTGGRIVYAGRDLAELAHEDQRILRRNMQIVFQDPASSLNPRMTIRGTVGEPLTINKLAKGEELTERIRVLLDTVGLKPEHMNRYPHEFSGGQKQRIGIARALALNPEFIVLDEPTSALDVSVQAQVLNLLKDLQQRLNLTYVFITHALNVVNHISDRVAVMYLGRVVELAPTDKLFAAPQHPYTQALLSAIPSTDPLEEKMKKRVILPGDVPSPVNPPSGCRFHPRCPIATDICNWDGERFAERAREVGGPGGILGDPSRWTLDRAGAVLPDVPADARMSDVERAVRELLEPDRARFDRRFWRVMKTDDGVRVDFEPPLADVTVPSPVEGDIDAEQDRTKHYAACFFAGTDITKAGTRRAVASRTSSDPTATYEATEEDLDRGRSQELPGSAPARRSPKGEA